MTQLIQFLGTWFGALCLGLWIPGAIFYGDKYKVLDFKKEWLLIIRDILATILWPVPFIYDMIKRMKDSASAKKAGEVIGLLLLPSLVMAAGSPEISLGEAFSYCFSQPSYLWTVIIGTLIGIACIIAAIKLQEKEDFTMKHVGLIAIGVVMIFACWLARPTKVKANTTPEQASRGVYIG